VQRNLGDLKSVASEPGTNHNLMRLLGGINEDLVYDITQMLFDHGTKGLGLGLTLTLTLTLSPSGSPDQTETAEYCRF